MAAITRLADLTDQDRRSLEGSIDEFARTWSEDLLADGSAISAPCLIVPGSLLQ